MKAVWWIPVALAADQLSKATVMRLMTRGQSIPVVGNYFRLTYIHNPGAAFSLNLGSPLIHTVVALVALAALIWMFHSTPVHERVTRLALTLVLGGALGNIVDRVRLHEVVDFLDFGVGSLRWPVFNLADCFVSIGVALLALAYLRPKTDTRAGSADTQESSEDCAAQS